MKTFDPIPKERFLGEPEETVTPFTFIVAVGSLTLGVIRAYA